MRKSALVILVTILLLMSSIFLAGCDDGNDENPSPTTPTPTQTPTITYIPTLVEKYFGEQLIVILEGDSTDHILSDQNLAAMEYFDNHFTPRLNIQYVLTPGFMIQLAKSVAGANAPSRSNVEWLTDPATGNLTSRASGVFFNRTAAMMVLCLKGGLTYAQKHDAIAEVKQVVKEAGFEGVKITVTGPPSFTDLISAQDLAYLQRLTGGTASINVLIESDNVTDPAVLQWMLDKERDISKKYRVANGWKIVSAKSIADLYVSSFGALPKDTKTAEIYLKLIPLRLWINLVTPDYTKANLVFTVISADSDSMKTTAIQLAQELANPPPGVKVHYPNEAATMATP